LNPLSETASLDSQVLLAHVTGKPRTWILAHPEARLTPDQECAVQTALDRLRVGEPLPYVLGHWEFYGLDFLVTPQTLIPRSETELLVDEALSWLRARPGRRLAADVGTGSGCIAVALAVNVPDLYILASDSSLPALQIARQNARLHGVAERLSCVQADLVPSVQVFFSLVCANLPYIPADQLRLLPVSRWEPWQALDGGADGLAAIRRLLLTAPQWLAPDGLLLIEIEASQGAAVRDLAQAVFPRAAVRILADLAGHDRLVRLEQPEV
jgi:release factor glutamine methyltransferase